MHPALAALFPLFAAASLLLVLPPVMYLSFRQEFGTLHPAWPPHFIFLVRRLLRAFGSSKQLKVREVVLGYGVVGLECPASLLVVGAARANGQSASLLCFKDGAERFLRPPPPPHFSLLAGVCKGALTLARAGWLGSTAV